MKEKIEQLSRGIFEYELPAIKLSEDKVSLSVPVDKRILHTVTVSNAAGAHMKGLVYSTNSRVILSGRQFIGKECTIEFTVNTEYSEVNDVIQGEIDIVSSLGEIVLPYEIKVTAPVLNTVAGKIYNMVQFAALARDNWEEARRIFTSTDFEMFLKHFEPDSRFVWERLLKSPSPDNAMEQFLIATRRKLPVSVQADRDVCSYDVGTSSFSDSIRLTKSNWGYVNLFAEENGDFIELEQKSISYDDFISGEFDLRYIIHPEKMHEGWNFGGISITGCGLSLNIRVICHVPNKNKSELEEKRRVKGLAIRGVENFISYNLNQIPAGRYVSEANAILDAYDRCSESDELFSKLYRAKLIRISGKESPAAAIINSLTEEEYENASPYAKGLYLYLLSEKMTTRKQEYLEMLYALCQDNPDCPLLQVFAIYADERYEKNIRMRFDELKGMYDKGCRMAIMFMEAAKLFNREPFMLKELDMFETSTVLFALRHDCCSRDLAVQFTSLVLRSKVYVKIQYNVLAMIYEKFQLRDTLTAICQILIKGYRKETKYFKWYQKGAEENIRISDLYEYYMYSIDRDVEEELDQAVLMYYVYNSKLNDKRLAYLYANIVLHKESNPIVYENYKDKLRLFALQQMRAGRNDGNLAIIYNDSLCDENSKKQFREQMGKVIFRCEVTCSNPLMKYVCVSHREMAEDIMVPLIGGKAQIDIYTHGAGVFMLDASNNRYFMPEGTEITELMPGDSLASMAYKYDRDNSQLILNLVEKAHRMRKFDQQSVELRKQAAAIQGITSSEEHMLISDLALYFYDHAQDEIKSEELKKIDYRQLTPVRRGKFIALLILHEQYGQAFRMMEECGFENVDLRVLEKFVISVPQASVNRDNKTLCELMYYLFVNGRRHERILIYLANYYNGLTNRMYDIWQEACLEQVATADFDERLLGQILFTESYLPYGEQIYSHYHRRARNRTLTKAYFNYLSYKYLISDVEIPEGITEILKRDSYFESNDYVMLACLKQLANARELTSEECEFAEKWLEIMVNKGKILPCFLNFSKYFRLPENMEDKVYIEYRSNPEHRVTIQIMTRQDGKRVMKEEAMRNVCYGIFIKEIILFSQETVEYIIKDESGQEVITSERCMLTGPAGDLTGSKTRFSSINAIINARNAKDRGRSIELLNDYVKREFAISQLFKPIDNG